MAEDNDKDTVLGGAEEVDVDVDAAAGQGDPSRAAASRRLVIGLFVTGLSLRFSDTQEHYFLDFCSLDLSQKALPSGAALGTLEALNVVGRVRLGPGYLVLVTEQKNVFEHRDSTIWNITRSAVIPLKLELARSCFQSSTMESQERHFSECEAVDKDDASDDETSGDEQSAVTSNSTSGSSQLGQNSAGQRDMMFSKMGVYVNDLKSNASLAVSNRRVNQLNYGIDGNVEDNDTEIQNDTSSFKLNRAITIKGLPKKIKDSNLFNFLEKSKVRKYDRLELDCHISSEMLCKFERQLQLFFSTGDFYYSTSIDLTRGIYFEDGELKTRDDQATNSFFYNEYMTSDIPSSFRIILIQGFINCLDLTFKHYDQTKPGKLLLISKRSTNRAGSRYLRRGIDDTGNVANFVMTSQILIVDDYVPNTSLFTRFDILRGSIPIFFEQDPSQLKPIPYLTRSLERCQEPFKKHFQTLKESYGNIASISLVERSKRESAIGEAYEQLSRDNGIPFDWFDFHEVCKKMKFDNVVKLLAEPLQNVGDAVTVEKYVVSSGWADSLCEKNQSGILRINCVDCLDRTNLVQKFLAEFILKRYIFEKYYLSPPDEFQTSYNNLWADNGDYISKQYSSTNALKGDYTRTSKRNYKGLIGDAFLTMSRYYSGYVSDYFKQCFIDYILGHQGEYIFEEFESTLNVMDPNYINQTLDKKKSVLQQVTERLGLETGVILIGSWSEFESPMVFNKLKFSNSTPLKKVSLLVTSKNIIMVDFDEVNDKIRATIEIPISSVKHLEYGTYILSKHNSLSTNPRRNVGVKIFFSHEDEAVEDDEQAGTDVDSPNDFITIKFPQDMEYKKVKNIIDLISKTCSSSTLDNKDIMSTKEASTRVIDLLEHRFKKMVWG